MKPRSSLPVAADRAFALWLSLDERVADFPTYARHSLGRHLLDDARGALDGLVAATFAPHGSARRVEALEVASHRLTMLQLSLRAARQRRYLAVDPHERANAECAEIARMTAAWLRRERAPSTGRP
jgi:hypothetical protein